MLRNDVKKDATDMVKNKATEFLHQQMNTAIRPVHRRWKEMGSKYWQKRS